MKTFLKMATAPNVSQTILVLKDDEGNVFGTFNSEAFKESSKFYGTGETFLFSFYKTEKIHCFHSTGINDHFIYSDKDIIGFGSSDNYFSLQIKDDLLKGYSKTTQTYKNPCLSDKSNFFICKLELWGIEI